MTILPSLAAFLVAATVLALTPGVDTAMVARAAGVDGPRRAILVAAGILAGCLVWGGAVSLGLGALLVASELAYAALKTAGAFYLIWLGIGLLRKKPAPETFAAAPDRAAGRPFLKGLATNLLNPKVGVFYVTFLPQFVPAGVNVAAFSFLLAVIHAAIGALWFALLIGASVPMTRVLARPRIARAIDRVTGCMFLGFGAKLLIEPRGG
jgi:threonine/homoserine/homoserine lactone efflux protein